VVDSTIHNPRKERYSFFICQRNSVRKGDYVRWLSRQRFSTIEAGTDGGGSVEVYAEAEEFGPYEGESPEGRPVLYKVEYNQENDAYEVVTDEDGNPVVSEAYVSCILWFEDVNGNKKYDDGELMTTDYFKQNTAYGVLLGISHRDAEEGFTVDMYNSTVRIAGEEYGMDAIPVTLVTETDASGNAVKTEQVTMYFYVFDVTGADPVYVPGDVDGDGDVDSNDADLIAKYFAGWPEEEPGDDFHHAAADMDGDGTVSRRDAMVLARKAAGWTNIGG